jgi:hypothetical protein
MTDGFMVTEAERERMISNYFGPDGNRKLDVLPQKGKKRMIILQYLTTKFQANRSYSEKEVNEILKPFHDDYFALRRYLVVYGLMDRTKDGRSYWLKEQ